MKVLHLLLLALEDLYLRWGMYEIDPLHPDLPKILIRRLEIAEKTRRIYA